MRFLFLAAALALPPLVTQAPITWPITEYPDRFCVHLLEGEECYDLHSAMDSSWFDTRVIPEPAPLAPGWQPPPSVKLSPHSIR